MDEQISVGQAIEARGYRAGWTRQQFAARQVAKLAEELGKLAEHFILPKALPIQIEIAGDGGKRAFDELGLWRLMGVDDVGQAKRELSDIMVVVLALADVLDELDPPFDVVAEAVAKATADVERGVR